MSMIHVHRSIYSIGLIFSVLLAGASATAHVHKTLPRCRCYPQEAIDISQSNVQCEETLLERKQLFTDKPYRSYMMRNAIRSSKSSQKMGGPSPLRRSLRKYQKSQNDDIKQKKVPNETGTNGKGSTMTKFPVVSYNLTYVADDRVHIYIDGKLVTCDTTAPKRRIKVHLKDVPCTDIVVRVKNESPRCRPVGGAGVGVLIDYDGKTYGSVPQDVQFPCEEDEDKDNRCFSTKGKQVIPITGYGAIDPADNCFPFIPYVGYNCNDCEVDRLDKVETCQLGYDPDLAEKESLKRPACDPKTWNTPLASADGLSNFPLCEFLAMGRNGGFTVNPIDGFHADQVVYGVRFELPFCKK